MAYAVRIAGVRMRRIALSFSLFGIIALVSRTVNSFQGPFNAARVELDIALHMNTGLLAAFRLFLLIATVATITGTFLIPTFQHCFSGQSEDELRPLGMGSGVIDIAAWFSSKRCLTTVCSYMRGAQSDLRQIKWASER